MDVVLNHMIWVDIILAFILDILVGDPYWLPHPVRFIGGLISRCERFLRQIIKRVKPGHGNGKAENNLELAAGACLMLLVVSISFLVVFFILRLATAVHPVLFHAINIYFLYTSLATRCLAHEAKKVYNVLKTGNIVEARKQLSMLVGRQTEHLDQQAVTRAVVETTAENTVDGVLSPLLYAVLGSFWGLGAPFAYAFKAISTLDSMVGYKNDKYLYFGRVSARTDDVANFLPARLSGLIIPASAFLIGLNGVKSFKIMLRDRRNHKSPNCAYPEAAFAGALGVQLGGANIYFGQVVEKPTIGDSDRAIDGQDIPRAIRLLFAAALLTLLLSLGVALLILSL